MKKIGITGGIGSGKSTVCEVFKLLDVPVFHADLAARQVQDNDPAIKSELKELFGDAIYTPAGVLDRRALASLIFANVNLLQKVNSLIHPAVQQRFNEWLKTKSELDYVLYEAAILIEGGNQAALDLIILVVADEEIRIRRVVKRDHINNEQVKDRIRNQLSDEEKMKFADYILVNNNNNLIIPEILKLDKILRSV